MSLTILLANSFPPVEREENRAAASGLLDLVDSVPSIVASWHAKRPQQNGGNTSTTSASPGNGRAANTNSSSTDARREGGFGGRARATNERRIDASGAARAGWDGASFPRCRLPSSATGRNATTSTATFTPWHDRTAE